jgi:hypothetical protein
VYQPRGGAQVFFTRFSFAFAPVILHPAQKTFGGVERKSADLSGAPDFQTAVIPLPNCRLLPKNRGTNCAKCFEIRRKCHAILNSRRAMRNFLLESEPLSPMAFRLDGRRHIPRPAPLGRSAREAETPDPVHSKDESTALQKAPESHRSF